MLLKKLILIKELYFKKEISFRNETEERKTNDFRESYSKKLSQEISVIYSVSLMLMKVKLLFRSFNKQSFLVLKHFK
jgi:hypothetical protein